jgi:hypothetical protein
MYHKLVICENGIIIITDMKHRTFTDYHLKVTMILKVRNPVRDDWKMQMSYEGGNEKMEPNGKQQRRTAICRKRAQGF